MARTSPFAGAGALVTGASSGIGVAIARRLAADGARLALTARRADRLEQVAALCREAGSPEVHAIPEDLGDPAAPERLAPRATSCLGGVDVLVDNAGFAVPGLFEKTSLERTRSMIEVNVTAHVALTRLLLPAMLERGRGHVLVVASMAGMLPAPFQSAYAGTKAFLLGWGESLRQEVLSRGVRVTVLCPGVTDTEFFGVAGYRNASKFLKHRMPADRVARVGLRALAKGRPCAVPGAVNKILVFAGTRLSPRRFAGWVSRRLMASRPPPTREP